MRQIISFSFQIVEHFVMLLAMLKTLFAKRPLPTVSFATSVWEKDWRFILSDPDYLRVRQIQNHSFPFHEKLLIINNVSDLPAVKRAALALIEENVLTRFVVADEIADELLGIFQLQRECFRVGSDAHTYENVTPAWIYYNALGPLAAIYSCQSEYLLYLTGDVRLDEPVDWIGAALKKMEREAHYKVANLTWNHKTQEVKRESIGKDGPFYVADQGFSDQMFLVRKADFCKPIYGEIREDAAHFPRGDVFEKRVFSWMKTHGWQRLTYRKGSYIHENF